MITWKYSLSHHACKQVFISFFPSLSFSCSFSFLVALRPRCSISSTLVSSFPVPRTGFFLGEYLPHYHSCHLLFVQRAKYSSFCTNPLFTLLRLEFIMTRLTHRFRGEFFLFALLGFVLDLIYNLSNMSP